jgi:hypothetical protein
MVSVFGWRSENRGQAGALPSRLTPGKNANMNVTSTPAAAPTVQAPRIAAPRDADGDNDGSRASAAPVAPKAAPLAPAGKPGSTLHVIA